MTDTPMTQTDDPPFDALVHARRVLDQWRGSPEPITGVGLAKVLDAILGAITAAQLTQDARQENCAAVEYVQAADLLDPERAVRSRRDSDADR